MTLVRTLLATAALCCVAASAAARDFDFELTPYAGYRFGGTFNIEGSDGSYKLDDATAFGLLLNWRHTGNTQWELLYGQQQSIARASNTAVPATDVDVDLHTLELGGTYQGDGERMRPYVALTIGGTHVRTDANGSRNDTFFSGSVGLGANFAPTSQFGLRLEARAHLVLVNSSTDLFCQTGPDINVCAVRVAGDTLTQVETFAGFVFRF